MKILRNLRTRLFHLYFLLRRPMTLGVRAIVEDKQGCILLVRHTYVEGWYFPGGGVEVGQTMEQALAMELREEVNIQHMAKWNCWEFTSIVIFPGGIMLHYTGCVTGESRGYFMQIGKSLK